jgi:hypothetical protein
MPSTGFEATIPARERPQTHALDCAATYEFLNSSCVSAGLLRFADNDINVKERVSRVKISTLLMAEAGFWTYLF